MFKYISIVIGAFFCLISIVGILVSFEQGFDGTNIFLIIFFALLAYPFLYKFGIKKVILSKKSTSKELKKGTNTVELTDDVKEELRDVAREAIKAQFIDSFKINGKSLSKFYPEEYDPKFSDFVAIDFETTGFSPEYDKIIEIGATKVLDGEIVDHYSALVNPGVSLPSKIVKITGIDDSMLFDKPSIDIVMPDFLDFISDLPIVAHNASFDMKFLLNNVNGKINNTVVDTLKLCRNYYAFENNKLKTVVENLDIKTDNLHRALADSYAAAHVYLKCKEKFELPSLLEKAALLEKSDIKMAIEEYENILKKNSQITKAYERLIILYRKNKDFKSEIITIERSIEAWQSFKKIDKEYMQKKIDELLLRMEKAKHLSQR